MAYAILLPIDVRTASALLLEESEPSTGLTLYASLIDTAGTIHATLRDIATGFTELGDGRYQWYSASIPDNYRGMAVFHTTAVGAGTDFSGVEIRAIQAINPEQHENVDVALSTIKAKTDNLPDDPASEATVTTLSAIFSGITSLANWLRAMTRTSTPDATALAEINSGGGSYVAAQHSLQAKVASVSYTISNVDVDPPAALGLTTGFVLCLGTDGLPEAGVTITAQLVSGPGTSGYALDTGTITMTSGGDGIAQHTGFVRGARYRFKRGRGNWTEDALAPDADTWELSEILGQE